MRLFVHYKKNGDIVSAARVDVMPKGLDHPYIDIGEDEAVLEVKTSAEVEKLVLHEIAERFSVDVRSQELKARGTPASPRAAASRRRRGDQ